MKNIPDYVWGGLFIASSLFLSISSIGGIWSFSNAISHKTPITDIWCAQQGGQMTWSKWDGDCGLTDKSKQCSFLTCVY